MRAQEDPEYGLLAKGWKAEAAGLLPPGEAVLRESPGAVGRRGDAAGGCESGWGLAEGVGEGLSSVPSAPGKPTLVNNDNHSDLLTRRCGNLGAAEGHGRSLH